MQKDTPLINKYGNLSLRMKRRNRSLEGQVIHFDVEFPNQYIQERLMIDAKQPVHSIHRLGILDDEPYTLEHTFMPVHLVPDLRREYLLASIYDHLHQESSVHFTGAYRAISTDKSDEHDQQYLNCAENDPALEVQQVVYLKDNQPIEYFSNRDRSDVRNYSVLDMRST